MSNSVRIAIEVANQEIKDKLLAQLSVFPFNGFEEQDEHLIGYYEEGEMDEEELNRILNGNGLRYSQSVIRSKNWNAEWESSFSPVVVKNFCAVRADFHPPVEGVQHEIIVTPKMSFGTGHHATTYLMMQEMARLDFKGKLVADFGTGTGVLAILAEKLGGSYVWAIDNDDWSIENAVENIGKNNCNYVHVEKVISFKTDGKFDIIIANINKNVILENISALVSGLELEGKVLLSGLLVADENQILLSTRQHNLLHVRTVERDGWISILLLNGSFNSTLS